MNNLHPKFIGHMQYKIQKPEMMITMAMMTTMMMKMMTDDDDGYDDRPEYKTLKYRYSHLIRTFSVDC